MSSQPLNEETKAEIRRLYAEGVRQTDIAKKLGLLRTRVHYVLKYAPLRSGQQSNALSQITDEQWRPIAGYEGLYEVSSYGRVRRLKNKGVHLSIPELMRLSSCEYAAVNLFRDRVAKTHRVHRLVALAFLGEPPAGRTHVCHKNGDSRDNRVENLMWGNYIINSSHKRDHGTAGSRPIPVEIVRGLRTLHKRLNFSLRSLVEIFGIPKTSLLRLLADEEQDADAA